MSLYGFMPTLGQHPHRVVSLLIQQYEAYCAQSALCGEAGVSQVEEVMSVSPLMSLNLSAHVRS